jgi:hypothetical protein
MITEQVVLKTTEPLSSSDDRDYLRARSFFPSLCWGAIIGGTVVAIGIHILFTALGVGGGLATFGPTTDANPVENFSIGAAIVWTACALVALCFGGFVAGRFSHTLHSGFVHGVLVWSLTLIITLLLLSMGTGMILGGALKVLGEGLGIGGKAVASATSGLVKEGDQRGKDQLSSFIDEAVQSGPTNSTPQAATRAKREIGFAVTKLFSPGNDVNSQDNRAAAIKALTDYSQMSEADATKTVDDWITSYNKLKTELDNLKATADKKAREAADRAASNLSCAAIWSFFALLAGLLVSSLGGSFGASCALRHAESDRLAVI